MTRFNVKVIASLLCYYIINTTLVVRFWLDHYPEDFTRSSPLIEYLRALQQAMEAANDMDLLELVSRDGMLVTRPYFVSHF